MWIECCNALLGGTVLVARQMDQGSQMLYHVPGNDIMHRDGRLNVGLCVCWTEHPLLPCHSFCTRLCLIAHATFHGDRPSLLSNAGVDVSKARCLPGTGPDPSQSCGCPGARGFARIPTPAALERAPEQSRGTLSAANYACGRQHTAA